MSRPYPSNMRCPNCERPNVYYIWKSKQYVAKCCSCGRYITADEMRSEFAKATKPHTNADKIRSMTDEELAHILKMTAKGGIIGQRSEEQWLAWLKQEVNE